MPRGVKDKDRGQKTERKLKIRGIRSDVVKSTRPRINDLSKCHIAATDFFLSFFMYLFYFRVNARKMLLAIG